MRILLDTNIIIPLEDSSKALEESFSDFVRLANEYGHQLLAHPSSLDDIKRDKDKERRKISLSRIKKYSFLENPPLPSIDDSSALEISPSTENDRVDNDILFAIYKNAANILVSEDRRLHNKASRLGIKDRVFYLQQAVSFLHRLYRQIPVELPNIQELPLYRIELTDPFFDSLREDYSGFDKWFCDKAQDGRKAWVYQEQSGELGAICIHKIENDPIVTSDDNRSIPGKVLKLCTFKVGETVRGRRIGELFFKAAFRFASANNLEHIYLHTHSEKHAFLIDFCKDFGFYHLGEYKGDDVYVKDHPLSPPNSNLSGLDYHKKFYPHFKADQSIGKYIVPIQPKFHKILFPDNQRQRTIFQQIGNSSGQVVGNAIRQAYLCHARLNGIEKGDILLFYRSSDMKAITSIGIVEQVGDYQNVDEIMQLVAKRTVYSQDEIKEMAKKQTKILLFRIALHLPDNIRFSWLKKHEIVRGNIQTIRKITNESFNKLAKEWAIPHCLYAD